VKSEIGFGLNMDEATYKVNVREFQHSLFAGPQAGVAGEHEPFDSMCGESRAEPRPRFFGYRLQQLVFLERKERIMDFGIGLEYLYPPRRTGILGKVTALFGKSQHRLDVGKHLVASNRLKRTTSVCNVRTISVVPPVRGRLTSRNVKLV
jgi:hypothetical protein